MPPRRPRRSRRDPSAAIGEETPRTARTPQTKLAELLGRLGAGNDSTLPDTTSPGRAASSGRRGQRSGSGAAGSGSSALGASLDQAIAIREFSTEVEDLKVREACGDWTFESEGLALHVHPDGRWISQGDGRGMRAKWRDDALEIDFRSGSDQRSSTTYRLLADSGELEVVRRLELRDAGNISVRLVYDAEKADGGDVPKPL